MLVGVSILTFLISHVVPSDPARTYAGPKADEETLNAIRERYHFNDPLLDQYFFYLGGLLQGDLGDALIDRQPVADHLARAFPASVELGIAASLFAIPAGIWLGIHSATHRNRPADHLNRVVALTGISIPSFWLALILQLALVSWLGLFPLDGRLDTGQEAPTSITGLYVLDSVLTGNLNTLEQSVRHLILPAFALGFSQLGLILRMTRSSMLEVLSADYIRTARAKGLSERLIVYKHALRNAMGPTLTVSGLLVGGTLTGVVFIESIFGWNGIGEYATKSAYALDFASILGFTLLVTLIYVAANLVVDVLYAFLDPQVRLGG